MAVWKMEGIYCVLSVEWWVSGCVEDKEFHCVLSDGMWQCGRWRESIVSCGVSGD